MVRFSDRIGMTPPLRDLFRNTRTPQGKVTTFTALRYTLYTLVTCVNALRISSLMCAGISMQSSYVNKPLLIDKCPRESKNSRIWRRTSSTCLGHPSNVNSITFRSWKAFSDSLQLITCGWPCRFNQVYKCLNVFYYVRFLF